MTATEFKALYYSPIVYCWKRGEQYIYIGKCYHGFRRMLAEHGDFKLDEMEDTDTIEIHHFSSKDECLRVERMLIYQHRPLRTGS